MTADFLAALRQFLTDPRLWKTVTVCFLLSCVAFAGLWAGLGYTLMWAAEYAGWLQSALTWGGWIGGFIIALLLFPSLFGFIGGFFYETVADAVDAAAFPHLPQANGAPLVASVISGIKYFILVLLLNALALPVYLTLLWVLGAGAGLYIVVNGILIGREQFEAVALRRLPPAQAKAWRRRHRFRIFTYGAATAALGLIPFLNFVTPLIGVAAMTRLVNRAVAD